MPSVWPRTQSPRSAKKLFAPLDGGPPSSYTGRYAPSALQDISRAPKHELNRRNPELQAQLDYLTGAVVRVQEQTDVLQKATGRTTTIAEYQSRLRSDLEMDLQALTAKVDSLNVTVSALVQSLVGLGASAFNWSEGLGTPRRKGLAELVLMYTRPCSLIDPRVEDLCADLGIELARERLDDNVITPWEASWEQRDGRSPAPGYPRLASPQRSKFQLKNTVQNSLRAWKDDDAGVDAEAQALLAAAPLTQKGAKFADVPVKGSISRLKVTIINAQGLRQADASSTTHPYCIFEIPGKSNSTSRTKVLQKTLTPYWNEAFFTEYAKGDPLKFTVRSRDGQVDALLGMVLLEPRRFFPGGFHGQLPLQQTEDGALDPQLLVRIEAVNGDYSDEHQFGAVPVSVSPTRTDSPGAMAKAATAPASQQQQPVSRSRTRNPLTVLGNLTGLRKRTPSPTREASPEQQPQS